MTGKPTSGTSKVEGFTPGPWDGETREYAGVKWDHIIRSARNRDPICTVFFAGYMEKEAAANARLIASAPAMAAEITRLRAALEKSADHFSFLAQLSWAKKLYDRKTNKPIKPWVAMREEALAGENDARAALAQGDGTT